MWGPKTQATEQIEEIAPRPEELPVIFLWKVALWGSENNVICKRREVSFQEQPLICVRRKVTQRC